MSTRSDPAPGVELPLRGGCGCGAVRFEITAPLVASLYCHCTRCQRRSGTGASANAVVAPGALRFLAGEELLGSWDPPDGAAKLFCTRCGSAVCSRVDGEPPTYGVRLGALEGDPGIRPSGHQFVAYAAPWEPLPDDGLPRWPERRPPAG